MHAVHVIKERLGIPLIVIYKHDYDGMPVW